MPNNFSLTMFTSNTFSSEQEKRVMIPHQHKSLEISYVISGELFLEYESAETGETIQTNIFPHQFFIIHPNCKHCVNIPHSLNSLGLELTPNANNLSSIFAHSEFCRDLPFFSETLNRFKDISIFNDTQNVRHILNGFQKFVNEPHEDFTPHLFDIQLRRLLIEILKCAQVDPNIPQYNPHLKKALIYIEANSRKPISAKDIAEYLELSEGYLQQLFSANLNSTVNDYINSERIRQAKHLIANSNYSLSLISASVGYKSIQTFIRNFQKFAKTTPSQYKRNTIKKNSSYFQISPP